ncbi:AGBL3, partial [Symbiodinium pilosum]
MMAATPSFIRAVPEEAELLYIAPESLFDDIVRAEADRISRPENVRNRIVYDSVGDPNQIEPTAFVPAISTSAQDPRGTTPSGPALLVTPYYTPTGPEDRTLVFESRFESGNLRRAVQAYEFEYDLILNPDYNTKSHTQWYFFRVGNTRKGPEYRFNILNMVKPTSVYNEGMRPLRYSSIDAATKGIGWARCGDRIAYYQNGLRRQKGANYYTLTFTVTFEHDCDEVYFSHCYPYTYTDLQLDLRALEKDPNMVRRLRRRKLCDTLAGNACDLITITSFCGDPAALKARRAVVITARVHPGESNASWVMKGILDYLTGASVDARILRDNFVFKIVPMLNPDGVIVGNYRCSLAGQDLNRLWDEPSRKMHPTIFFTKSMFRHLLDDRDVILYVDIHGHSRKKNVFMYGNSESNGLREKIFPGLLCRSSDCFSFDDCCFKIQKSKESTARVVAYKELGVVNSYTLEASFCGADFGPLGEQHFTTRHLEEMGYMVCDAILDFCDPDQGKVMLVCKELQGLFPDDGNSDDVSDSEDDGAAALRRKKRAARKAVKQREKPQKKKKPARSDGRAKMDSEDVNMEEDRRRENKDKSARNAMNAMRKASRRDPGEDSNAAGSNAPEMSDAEDAKGKRKKPKKKAAKSRAVMSSRDKDSKEAKTPKDRSRAEPALEDDPPELA